MTQFSQMKMESLKSILIDSIEISTQSKNNNHNHNCSLKYGDTTKFFLKETKK
uniref:Uncharacterized protein n=1 Tax=Rhizophora mucronata TaxID=61149 RepID=A0A2P2NTU2_RHIMU